MPPVRLFLDANILFSAANSDGAVRALLRLLLDERHTPVADSFVVHEAERNLAAKGRGDALEDLAKLLTVLEVHPARVPHDAEWLDWLPPKDRPVLAAAAALGCTVIVTGDKTHFGKGYGKAFGGVTIFSPAMAAATLLAG